jgi:hypothetical protein
MHIKMASVTRDLCTGSHANMAPTVVEQDASRVLPRAFVRVEPSGHCAQPAGDVVVS